MKKTHPPMLRWILGHGSARIACELNQNADRTFDLRILPSWGDRPRIVNRFSDLIAAMERHAEVAGQLRESGWRVIERTSPADRIAA